MTTFSPHSVCRHNTQMDYLDDYGYDAESKIMEEIPAGGYSYVYMVGDFSFGLLPEDEQLLVIPFVMKTLRMAGLGECDVGPLHPEDKEVTEVRLRYAGFREGDRVESYLKYTTRYISFFVRAAWHPDSESIPEPQVYRGAREGERVGTDQSEFVRRGRSDLPSLW